jgi:lysophospholipase L1-like esterase
MAGEALPLVHVVGDSISMHYGPILERMLAGVARYSRKPPETADPDSANGRDSDAVVAYLRGPLTPAAGAVDLLVVNCGLHDIKRTAAGASPAVPPDRYRANLARIVAHARGVKARLVWIRTTPVDDETHNGRWAPGFHRYAADVAAYNGIADVMMGAAGAPLVDLHGFTVGLGPGVYADHVHFVESVRALQAAFIAGHLSRLIADAQTKQGDTDALPTP